MGENKDLRNPYSPYKIFYHADKISNIQRGERTAPVYVRIKPTNLCNQNCYYCIYANGNFKGREIARSDYIPWPKMEEILDDLEEMGVKAVTLSGGGDPLCYRYINDLLAKIIRMGADYAVITNGQALTGRTAEQLTNANWVRISLDSASDEHYFQMRGVRTFDKVISNVTRFAEIKNPHCELGINFVVTKENSGDVYKICETAKKIGVNNIKFSPALQWDNSLLYHQDIRRAVTEEIGRAAADFGGSEFIITDKYSDDIYFAQNSCKNYTRCYISEFFTVIAADCKVYMCHQKSYTKEGEIGDLSNCSFKELWFSKDIQKKMKNFRPDCVCDNVCAFEERNRLLHSVLNVDRRFINFI